MGLCCLLLLLTGVCGALGVVVEEGSSTVLDCYYDLQATTKFASLKWYFSPQNSIGTGQGKAIWGLYMQKDGTYAESQADKSIDIQRVNEHVDVRSGHSIQLLNIPATLDGDFRCRIDIVEAEQYEDRLVTTITLYVTVRPSPQVIFMDEDSWVEGESVRVHCEIPRVKPMVDTLYLEGHSSIVSDQPTNKLEGSTYLIRQENRLTLQWTDNGETSLSCVAPWNGMEVVSEGKLVVDLKYSPKQSPNHPTYFYAPKDDSTNVLFYFYANPEPQSLVTGCVVNSTTAQHFYIAIIHIETVTDEEFRTHECTVGNSVGDAVLHAELGNLSMKNAGLVTGIVIGLLCVVGALAIVAYIVWKKRKAHTRTPPQNSRVSYTKEQNGNYEPYCELADEREKRVTPQRPIPANRPVTEDDMDTYDEVETDLKKDPQSNPKPVGTEYSEVYVKQLPPGEKPMVKQTVPKTEYSAVQFNNPQNNHIDTDSD